MHLPSKKGNFGALGYVPEMHENCESSAQQPSAETLRNSSRAQIQQNCTRVCQPESAIFMHSAECKNCKKLPTRLQRQIFKIIYSKFQNLMQFLVQFSAAIACRNSAAIVLCTLLQFRCNRLMQLYCKFILHFCFNSAAIVCCNRLLRFCCTPSAYALAIS